MFVFRSSKDNNNIKLICFKSKINTIKSIAGVIKKELSGDTLINLIIQNTDHLYTYAFDL